MKAVLFRILALLVAAFLLLAETESFAARGGRGGGGGGGGVSRSQNAPRPSSSRAGGLAPSKNVGGGNIKGSQAASKVQSRPKGSATTLPSTAQAKRPASAGGGTKGGFPDLAAKTAGGGKLGSQGGGKLAGKAQGAQGGQLASKAQGAQGGQVAGKLQGAQGSQLAGKLQGAQAGALAGGLAGGALAGSLAGGQGSELGARLQGGSAGQLGNNFSPQRNQAIADRQKYWDKWGKDNQGKLTDFRANRGKEWGNINNFRNNQNLANSFNKPEWNNYKNNVNDFRSNRSIEINNNIQNNFDNNFNDNWWGSSGWYHGRSYWGGNPWWWWGAATAATVGTFLAIDAIHDATYTPPVYDYGVNVIYQGDEVYVDGKPTATAKQYSQQAIALANTPAEQPPPPVPPAEGQQPEYLPMGVWALAQEEKGDAYMFFQISIDKNGVLTGAYQNVLSGEKSPISGQVDKKTQRVAWKIGTNNTVIETGLQNLTQDVASCLVHFGPDTTQTWLLVRLKQPEMPNAPQTASADTNKS